MEQEPNFIKDFGAIIIALIALIQPWLHWIWKRFIKPTKIKFYQTGNIELGYSNYATTIGINGTLRSTERDVYVNRIHLEIERQRDHSKHVLNWAVMRGTKINLSNSRDVEVELPYGFLLSKDLPKRLNIQFHDQDQQAEINPLYNSLTDSWATFTNERYPVAEQLEDDDSTYRIKMRQVYNEFTGTPEATGPWADIDRNFYLESGDYKLKLTVTTSNPDKEFSFDWTFSIAEQESQHVRANTIKLTDFACGQLDGDWNFSNVNFDN